MSGGSGVQHRPVAVGVGGRDGLAHFCAAEQNATSGVYARCWWLRAHLAAMTKLVWPWTAGSARACSSDKGSAGDAAATAVNGDESFFHIWGGFLRQRVAFQGLKIEIIVVVVFHWTTCESFKGAL